MVLFRYAGYCPQLKYHVGQTYGQLTAKLLSSPEVSHSQRLVLHTGRFPSTEKDSGPHDEIWRSRHGGRRNLEKMIPGYTGNSFGVCNTWCLVCKAGNMHYTVSLSCAPRFCSIASKLLLQNICRNLSRCTIRVQPGTRKETACSFCWPAFCCQWHATPRLQSKLSQSNYFSFTAPLCRVTLFNYTC